VIHSASHSVKQEFIQTAIHSGMDLRRQGVVQTVELNQRQPKRKTLSRTNIEFKQGGAQQVCRCFFLVIGDDNITFELSNNSFVEQALWSARGTSGVAT
jgi:hypothetical protein